ncbi:MAG: MFS transporter [Planctomycetaceae bacterium]
MNAISPRATRVRYLVAALIASGAVSLYLPRHCLAVTNKEIQQELGIGSTEMGAVMGLFSLGYLLFQVPGGWLGTRFGTRWGLSALSIVWSLLTLATAAAHSLLPLEIARFLFGAAQAGFVPITAKILKDWFPEKQWGITSAFVGVSMSIGGALAMDVTGRLTGAFDWRVIFQMYSVVGVFWSIAFVTLFRNTPRDHPWTNADEIALIAAGSPSATGAAAAGRFLTLKNLGIIVCSVNLWAICLQSFCRAAGYNFFVTFFPEFLTHNFDGVDAAQAGLFTKWPMIGVVCGGLFGGVLIDRIYIRTGNKWLSRSAVAVAALTLTSLLTFVSFYATSPFGFVALITIGAACSGVGSPAAWAATLDVGGKHTSVVAGIMNMAGCISGVVVTPLLGGMMDILKGKEQAVTVKVLGQGVLLDSTRVTDWSQVIEMHAAFYLAGAVFWLFVRSDKPLLPEST